MRTEFSVTAALDLSRLGLKRVYGRRTTGPPNGDPVVTVRMSGQATLTGAVAVFLNFRWM